MRTRSASRSRSARCHTCSTSEKPPAVPRWRTLSSGSSAAARASSAGVDSRVRKSVSSSRRFICNSILPLRRWRLESFPNWPPPDET